MSAPSPLTQPTVTIAINASLSAATYIGIGQILGLYMPTGWDAADITVQSSPDGGTYQDVYDDANNVLTIKAGASRNIAMIIPFKAGPWIKLRSGTPSVAVNQTAARTITLLVQKVAIPALALS